MSGPWQAFDAAGQPIAVTCPGDWAQQHGWETFAGRLCFVTTLTLSADQIAQPLFLDLGQVGDIAEVAINDQVVGVCAWAPYCLRIDPYCQVGLNRVTVWVTNSSANFYEGRQLPAGLLGPILLRSAA